MKADSNMLCVLFHAIQAILFLYIMPNTKQTTGKPHSVMAIQTNSLFALLILLGSASASNFVAAAKITNNYDTAFLNRTSFPPGFIFGTASSAYQVKHSTLLISISHSAEVFQLKKKKERRIHHRTTYLFLFFIFSPSMKVQQLKVEEVQAYGILTLTDTQVFICLFLFIFIFSIFLLTGIVKC